MGLISQESIDAVIEANDIVDVVSAYVSLEKKSALNLFGLCPFHSEKTPSFSVSPGKQIFYCFGCQKGGNVVKFIQEIEHLSYPESIRFLADRAGVALEEKDDPRWKERLERRNKAYEAMREAARYFYASLEGSEGREARDYLAGRGIARRFWRLYGLGYSPPARTALYRALLDRGITEQAMLDGGLIRKSADSACHDFFFRRLMFPIMDTNGRVLAFGGRAIADEGPKYVNSPETYLYKKGKHLFGITQAVKTSSPHWYLVEGYLDVLSLAKTGRNHAVAPLGTALTDDQARLIRRHVENVRLLLDSDQAGIDAALRAGEILGEAGVAVQYLLLDGAKDPDDYLKRFGPERLASALREPLDRTGFRLQVLKQESGGTFGLSDHSYRDRALDLLAEEEDGTRREIYGGQLARELQISYRTVIEEVDRRRRLVSDRSRKEELPRPGPAAKPTAPKDRPALFNQDETWLLMMLALNNQLRAQGLDINHQKIADFALSEKVRAFLMSDAVSSRLNSSDLSAGPMREIGTLAIDEADAGRLTLAGLHSIVDSILTGREQKEGTGIDPDQIHTLLQQHYQAVNPDRMPLEHQRRLFGQKLARLRLSRWRHQASLLNQRARELELEGREEEAGQDYAKAAGLITAADTFRMILQGEK